jgi:NAD(P)H-hydrate repair Nnr-like enzyme with NAD(P)H-hydrate epimerase domain
VLTFTGHAPTLQVAAGTVVIEVPSGALTLTGQAPFEYGLFVVFVATDEAIARDATITTTAQRQSRLLTTADRDAQITS